jgi:hypothetical protein
VDLFAHHFGHPLAVLDLDALGETHVARSATDDLGDIAQHLAEPVRRNTHHDDLGTRKGFLHVVRRDQLIG